jgi:DNA-binding Xre family transcriptional regulator
MANNLDTMIRRSGMTNKQVAEEKGVKPETLSRHKSGAIQISRNDADEYAQILNCLPQQILYANTPIPLLGYVDRNFKAWRDRSTYFDSADGCINSIYMAAYYHQWTVAMEWSQEIEGTYRWLAGAISIYDFDKARFNQVDPQCFMKPSLVKERDTHRLLLGDLYPVPGKKTFTVFNDGELKSFEDIDVEWAAPLLEMITRPCLRGVEKVCLPKEEVSGFFETWAPSKNLPELT